MKRSFFFTVLIIFLCLFATDVFSQNSREVVFSKTVISPSSPAGLSTEFAAGDPVYAVAFFDQTILELGGSPTAKNVSFEIFIYELKPPLYHYQQPSEVQLETSVLTVSGDALQKKYLFLDIVPDVKNMTAYGNPALVYEKFGPKFYGPVKFAEQLGKLEPGKHTLLVKVNCNYNLVAEGRFLIDGDNYSGYQKLSDDLNAAASGAKTRDVTLPPSALSDKTLEAEMVSALKASQTYKERIKGDILRLVIIDNDWTIRRHDLTGAILHRYIRAAVAVKNSDNTCTLWQLITFQQDFAGDQFQATRFDGVGDPLPMPCENINR